MTLADLALLWERIWPVLMFLFAITIVAEIAEAAGVFDVAASWASRAGGGRVWLLWLVVVLLSVVATVVLSLDTTAVLLTPVVIKVARHVNVPPLPFAMTTVCLANTASLLLPVSNLTNLLALDRFSQLGVSPGGYVRIAALPAFAAIVATVTVLATLHRKQLGGRYELAVVPHEYDRVLLGVSSVVCLLLAPAFVSGIPPMISAGVAAVALVAISLARFPELLRTISIPWKMFIGVSLLFTVVGLFGQHGLNAGIGSIVGNGLDDADLFRVGGIGALAANLGNNLPAYFAMELAVSDDPKRLMALIIGVNAGSLVTVWASLATILWRERCRSAGLTIRTSTFIWQGAAVGGAAVSAALVALVLS